MSRRSLLTMLIVSVLTFLAVPAADAEKKVFINGMDMSKYLLTNITLKCVTVKFDAKGNIYIIAEGYNFKPSKTVKENPEKVDKLANKFYLVTFPKPAKVNLGYDIDVIINSKFVKRVYGTSGQIVYDVTSSMKGGDNTVVFLAKRNGTKKPRTGSMKIAIAKGYESKGTYIIKNLIWEVKRSSKESKASYYSKQVIKK